ncbi:MAG: hypothetical protein VYE68_16770 [Acidobacteriota bacterium]|nr:hypothetical protein [Acidobacteriota bacterium]
MASINTQRIGNGRRMRRNVRWLLVVVGVLSVQVGLTPFPVVGEQLTAADEAGYAVDPFWPQALPTGWLFGNVVGVATDSRDNVWIIHRPNSQRGAEGTPPVVAFSPDGAVAHSWGGPGDGYDWGTQTHGIYVDHDDNVWVGFGGGLPYDPTARTTTDNALVLKFTPSGTFLLQIGDFGEGTDGNDSTRFLGQPTDVWVDEDANEVYISDGYTNRRVIVFDATTGDYRRHWGGYGEMPTDGDIAGRGDDRPRPFSTPHCVNGSSDGLVYVCDRGNRRIQVFNPDGTFVSERVLDATLVDGSVGGTPWDIEFSLDTDQSQLLVADGGAHAVHILERTSLEVVRTFGRRGRWAGQFESPHNLALDSRGNLFVAETLDGRRVQKFVRAP